MYGDTLPCLGFTLQPLLSYASRKGPNSRLGWGGESFAPPESSPGK